MCLQEPQTHADPQAGSWRGSPLVECHLCGKKFGSRSIAIHEPQCLKRWQQSRQGHALDKPRGQSLSGAPPEGPPPLLSTPAAMRLTPLGRKARSLPNGSLDEAFPRSLERLIPHPIPDDSRDEVFPKPRRRSKRRPNGAVSQDEVFPKSPDRPPTHDPLDEVFPKPQEHPSSQPRISLSTKHRQRSEGRGVAAVSPPRRSPSPESSEEVSPGEALFRRKEGSVMDVLLPRNSGQPYSSQHQTQPQALLIIFHAVPAAPAPPAPSPVPVQRVVEIPAESSEPPAPAAPPEPPPTDGHPSQPTESTSSSSTSSCSSPPAPVPHHSAAPSAARRENWCRPSFRVEEDGSTTYRCRVCDHGPFRRRHYFRSPQ